MSLGCGPEYAGVYFRNYFYKTDTRPFGESLYTSLVRFSNERMNDVHPCQKCGACCAFFRVAFYWREAEAGEHDKFVPAGTWQESNDQQRCMKGTELKHQPKCVALAGKIGHQVACSIYKNRSSTCRNFQASFENGERNKRCDEARAQHGLVPLTKQNWLTGYGKRL